MSNTMRAATLSSALVNKPVLSHEQTVLQECQGGGRKRKKSKERGRKHGTRKRPKHTQVDSVLRRVKADEEEDPVHRGEKHSRSLNEISISGAQGEKPDVRVKSGGPEREGLGFGEGGRSKGRERLLEACEGIREVGEDSVDGAADCTPQDVERDHALESHDDHVDDKGTNVGNKPEWMAIKDKENIEDSWNLLDQDEQTNRKEDCLDMVGSRDEDYQGKQVECRPGEDKVEHVKNETKLEEIWEDAKTGSEKDNERIEDPVTEIHHSVGGLEEISENESNLRLQRSNFAEEPWTAEEDEVLIAARRQGIRFSAIGPYLFPSRPVRAMAKRYTQIKIERSKLTGHDCKSNKTHHGTEADGLCSVDSAPETIGPETGSHTEGLDKHLVRTMHAKDSPNNSERVAQLKEDPPMTSEKQSGGCDSNRSSPSLIARYEAFVKESSLIGLSVHRTVGKEWTREEDEALMGARARGDSWTRVSCDILPTRSLALLWHRHSNLLALGRQGVQVQYSAGLWSGEEEKALLELRKRGMTFQDISKYHLPVRSSQAIEHRSRLLRNGIERAGGFEAVSTTTAPPWSHESDDLLRRLRSQHVSYAEIQKDHLPERTLSALYHHHQILRKRSEKLQSVDGCGEPQTRKRFETVRRTEKHSDHEGSTSCL